MIALIQRVNYCRLTIDQQLHSEIGPGLLALIGLEKGDDLQGGKKLLQKLLAYRVFGDDEGKMNLSLADTAGELMLVSQFTLAAATDKGLRPSFSSAMPPTEAEPMFAQLLEMAREMHPVVQAGVFGADMKLALENDGPVTFHLRVKPG